MGTTIRNENVKKSFFGKIMSREDIYNLFSFKLNKPVKIDYIAAKELAAKKLKAMGIDSKLYEAVQITEGWTVMPSDKDYTPDIGAVKTERSYESDINKNGIPKFLFYSEINHDYLVRIEGVKNPGTNAKKKWVIYEKDHPEKVFKEITTREEAVKYFRKDIVKETISGYFDGNGGCFYDPAFTQPIPTVTEINGEEVNVICKDINTDILYSFKSKNREGTAFNVWIPENDYMGIHPENIINAYPV